MSFTDSAVSLVFKIKADGSNAEAELKKFGQTLQNEVAGSSKTASAAIDKLTSSLGLSSEGLAAFANPVTLAAAAIAGIAVASVAVGKELLELAKTSAEFGSKIYDASVKTGLSAEAISALDLAAQQSGVSLEAATSSVNKFQKSVASAREGNKSAVDSMERLFGKDWQNQTANAENALEGVFKKVSSLQDPYARVKAATDAFGRSGVDFLKIIDQSGGSFEDFKKKAIEAGQTLSDEDVKACDDFADALASLERQGQVLTAKFAVQYMPQITDAIQKIEGFFASHQEGIKGFGQAIAGVIKTLADLVQFVDDHPTISRIIAGGASFGTSEALVSTYNNFQTIGKNAQNSVNPSGNYTPQQLLDAMRKGTGTQESNGRTVDSKGNPITNARTGATGMFQVLPKNIPEWTSKTPGVGEMSVEQFQKNADAQIKVFNKYMGEYLAEAMSKANGNVEETFRRAAVRWYGGSSDQFDQNWSPNPGKEPTRAEYTQSVANRSMKALGTKSASGADDYLENQKEKDKQAEEAKKESLNQNKILSQQEQKDIEDYLSTMKRLHDKGLSNAKAYAAEETAAADQLFQSKLKRISDDREALKKRDSEASEPDKNSAKELRQLDADEEDARREHAKRLEQIADEQQQNELTKSRQRFAQSESLRKQLDASQTAQIQEDAEKGRKSFETAENETYRIQAAAIARQVAQYDEEIRLAKGNNTELEKLRNERQKAQNESGLLEENHRRANLLAKEKDYQLERAQTESRNRIAETQDNARIEQIRENMQRGKILGVEGEDQISDILLDGFNRREEILKKDLEHNKNNVTATNQINDQLKELYAEREAFLAATGIRIRASVDQDIAKQKQANQELINLRNEIQGLKDETKNIEIEQQKSAIEGKLRKTPNDRGLLNQMQGLEIEQVQNKYYAGGDHLEKEHQKAIADLEERAKTELAVKQNLEQEKAAIDEDYKQKAIVSFNDYLFQIQKINQQYKDNSEIGFGAAFTEDIKKFTEDPAIQSFSATLTSMGHLAADTMLNMANAVGSAVEQWALYGGSVTKALKQALAAELAHVAGVATVKALEATALGFLNLAYGNFAGAGNAFLSAAAWAALAGTTAVIARGVAGDTNKANTAASSAGSTGPAANNLSSQSSNDARAIVESRRDSQEYNRKEIQKQQIELSLRVEHTQQSNGEWFSRTFIDKLDRRTDVHRALVTLIDERQ